MAQIALPRQHVTQAPPSAAAGSPLYQRRSASTAGPVELIPNPDFTFPMRDPDSTSSESAPASNPRPMSLQPPSGARRGSAPAGRRQKSVSALPDFSFNPAGPSTSKPANTTPPHSPLLATPTTPSRSIGGHRRGGSEFIGGDARAGGAPPMLSTSPTKSDDGISSSGGLRPVAPHGRRGHAHRRSAAISSHDLSAIINPPPPPPPARAGSAPVTPMEGDEFKFGHSVNKSMSQPSLRGNSSFNESPDASRRPPSRARVGFSDKVEYIRPLSTISSETEVSTIRGHSTTNSLSSIISGAGTSSPKTARTGRPSLSTTPEDEGRPSTAGAILDNYKNAHFGEELFNRKRPSSAVSPNSPTAVACPNSPRLPAKRRGFFRLRGDHGSPALQASASDPSMSVLLDSPLPSPMVEDEDTADDSERPKSNSRKAGRKPRKVKSWANSIITKKGKSGKKSKVRPPTPPPESVPDAEDTDASEDLDLEARLNFDIDNTVTIVSPTEAAAPKIETDISSWKPRELKRVDSDTMSPVIDLDAALGPFNTPQGPNANGRQRGFGAHRRAMHSAGGLLQHHRRTESAPELVPFEHRPTTAAKTSPMADVFEEDEPEEEASEAKTPPKSPAMLAYEPEEQAEEPKIQVVETEGSHNGPSINWNFNDTPIKKRKDRVRQDSSPPLSPLAVPPSASSPKQPKTAIDVSPVEVVEDYEEPRTSSLTHSSDSTVTQIPIEETKENQSVMNVGLPLPQQTLMTPDTFTSSFSSPDFRSSQASLDTPRLGTAASSMTDYRAMSSPQFGEPGPELRISVDDVPSLTSSRSTMTSAMQSAFPMMSPRNPGDRSASLCSVPSDVDSRRRKRSSIASLSRLINHSSSFGEKSKLSIEQRPHSEYLEPSKDSKKRHKRLSKLMQFWKPKDTSRA
ncbi:hypothetical protein BS50DRAFT_589240 [Corynespora cassiicola Philippines]|uniref:Cell wall proline rich protein n=1 Tax=Corynespora cassiicola Philippines TaxID=1448308 RepID=A0A2T2NM53_CORCC|nr:hypothetical protein BS50DRAFT_589240 [Corynespora cassiicola Philippines]